MNSEKKLLKKGLAAVAAGTLALAGIFLGVPETFRHAMAFACFALCAAGFFAAACVYFFTPRFLPYHQEASGMVWEELTPQFRGMILAVLRIVAGGFFCASVAAFVLLWIPFRQGLGWAGPAIFVIYNSMAVPTLYGTVLVAVKTPGSPPVVPVIIAIWLSFMGLTLSF